MVGLTRAHVDQESVGGEPVSYQPGWVDGREVGTGERDAAGRYEAIRRELQGHTGFSVLDVGAYSGYFSVRLAEEFEATVIAADKVLKRHPIDTPGVVSVPRNLTGLELSQLTHAGLDVVLLLSVLHHVDWWRDMLLIAVERSQVVFVELPDPREILPNAIAHGEAVEMHRQVQALGGIVIAWTPGYDGRYNRPTYAIGRLT